MTESPQHDATERLVAVVGTGSIGMRHLRVLAAVPGVVPVAVPARAERRPVLSAEGFRVAADLDAAAAMGARQAVIATETRRHVDDGLAALERGLDVLVEKPLAPSASEAERLVERAEALGRVVAVGCVLRFSTSLLRFRDWLPTIGRVHTVRIECQSYLPDWRPGRSYRESYAARAEEGGVLRDLIHEVDYAGWLFGWPVWVQGRVRNLGRLGIESEEAAELLWESPEDVLISMSLDYLSRPARRVMRASGEHGTLEWDGIEGRTICWQAGGASEVANTTQSRDEMLRDQDVAFLETCAGRPHPLLARGPDGVAAVGVCDAVRQRSIEARGIAGAAP